MVRASRNVVAASLVTVSMVGILPEQVEGRMLAMLSSAARREKLFSGGQSTGSSRLQSPTRLSTSTLVRSDTPNTVNQQMAIPTRADDKPLITLNYQEKNFFESTYISAYAFDNTNAAQGKPRTNPFLRQPYHVSPVFEWWLNNGRGSHYQQVYSKFTWDEQQAVRKEFIFEFSTFDQALFETHIFPDHFSGVRAPSETIYRQYLTWMRSKGNAWYMSENAPSQMVDVVTNPDSPLSVATFCQTGPIQQLLKALALRNGNH